MIVSERNGNIEDVAKQPAAIVTALAAELAAKAKEAGIGGDDSTGKEAELDTTARAFLAGDTPHD